MTRLLRRMMPSLTALAVTATFACQTAHAAQVAKCLTPAEAESVAVSALPDALSSAQKACAPHLPARSALRNATTRVSQVYRPAADKAWPNAGRAFLSAVELPLPEGTSPDVVRPLLLATISALVEQEIKPEDCGTIDEFYSALEPLPPENVGKLLVAFLKLGESGKKAGQARPTPFKICEGEKQ
jgi:hypothetical protein